MKTALAVPLAQVVMGAGFPITTWAGGVLGQRCGVHQASPSAAVEAKRRGAAMLELAAALWVAYDLD